MLPGRLPADRHSSTPGSEAETFQTSIRYARCFCFFCFFNQCGVGVGCWGGHQMINWLKKAMVSALALPPACVCLRKSAASQTASVFSRLLTFLIIINAFALIMTEQRSRWAEGGCRICACVWGRGGAGIQALRDRGSGLGPIRF